MNEKARIERVITSAPLNVTARDVTEGAAEHWDSQARPMFDTPPPMRAIPLGVEDLRGRTFGRFTVLGVYAKFNTKKQLRWVCRCSCGGFELRSMRTVLEPKDAREGMCARCAYLETVKWRYVNLPPRDFTKAGATTPAERRKRIADERSRREITARPIADRLNAASGSEKHEREVRRSLFARNPNCHWCGRLTRWLPLANGALPPDAATSDHMVSRNHRLPGQRTRIVLACYECNQRRNTEEIRAIPIETRRAKSMAAQLAVERASLPGSRSIAEQLGGSEPVPQRRDAYDCPLCTRRGLTDASAFWSHMAMRHSPDEISASGDVEDDMPAHLESALIRICNAETIDDAVVIATEALSRGGEVEGA